MDRVSITRRPQGTCKGFQTWSDLAFLHWKVPPEILRPLIPSELEVDTFDGTAWVGLVPFYMSNVRPRLLPPLPGLSYFCETNVRTYVHRQGKDPGVWFFSLDAKNRIAVAIARRFWNLNYYYSRMDLQKQRETIQYTGCRPDSSGRYNIEVQWNAPPEREHLFNAEPGSLEHFLAERYLLYTCDRKGDLLSGRVHHKPYPLVNALTTRCEESLCLANELAVSTHPDHTLFSPGVDVEVFALRPV